MLRKHQHSLYECHPPRALRGTCCNSQYPQTLNPQWSLWNANKHFIQSSSTTISWRNTLRLCLVVSCIFWGSPMQHPSQLARIACVKTTRSYSCRGRFCGLQTQMAPPPAPPSPKHHGTPNAAQQKVLSEQVGSSFEYAPRADL